MKKTTRSTEKNNKLNPMSDTRNYAAGREGEDILDRDDEETDEDDEPLPEEIAFPEESKESEDDEDEDDEDEPPTLFLNF